MAVSRHLGFYRTANPQNPIELNMEWIGCTVCTYVCGSVFYPPVTSGLRRLGLNDSRYGLTFRLWAYFSESIISIFSFHYWRKGLQVTDSTRLSSDLN